MHIFLHVSLVTRNGKIVWKHGLNWSFNALQNQAILELIVLYCDYCHFFFFFEQNTNIAGSNCAIIG